MTKEEAKYLSEVMRAYGEGRTIQLLDLTGTWMDCSGEVLFNARTSSYRIKPEPKLRPYANAREFLQAQKEHGLYLVWKGSEDNTTVIPHTIRDSGVRFQDSFVVFAFEDVLNMCTWQDGTPCGIMED